MLRHLIFPIILATVLSHPAQTQATPTPSKYPMSSAFAVRRNVWMFVRYSPNGQACELSFEPRHWTGDTMIVDSELDRDEVLKIIDEVVPESERGKRHEGFPNGMGTITGRMFTSMYDYDKLSVEFAGGTKSGVAVAVVTWPDRHCPADRK